MRRVFIARGIAFVIFISGLGLYFFLMRPTSTLATTTITINNTALAVEVAQTPAQQERGLSGRVSLEEGHGMLFVFDAPSNWGIWMKDMLFPIDIVWAGEDGTINTIKENISPDTYPAAFYPDEPSLYVLEIPAGYAAAHNIAKGHKIVLK